MNKGTHGNSYVCRTVESESPVKLSRRMIDLRSGPAHVGKHDDRTATQTTEDLAGALTSDDCPNAGNNCVNPPCFCTVNLWRQKTRPQRLVRPSPGNETSMAQHSILSLLQRHAGAETTGCALGLPACHRSRSARSCMIGSELAATQKQLRSDDVRSSRQGSTS